METEIVIDKKNKKYSGLVKLLNCLMGIILPLF